MGWFRSSDEETESGDPLRKLDPSLRAFLEKESPIKYKPTPTEPSDSRPESKSAGRYRKAVLPEQADQTSKSSPSKQTYQDERYADLWKNYRPIETIEAESKSDQEKLLDVLEGYRSRKAQIGRAAIENCALEQIAIRDCYSAGSVGRKLLMCRAETKAFERCYTIQAQFLKALGYLNSYDRPESVDEEIQMHADKLYHQMLEQEAAANTAKEAGLPEPQFASILSAVSESTPKESSPSQSGSSQTSASLTGSANQRGKTMKEIEKQLQEKSNVAEANIALEAQDRMNQLNDASRRNKNGGTANGAESETGIKAWVDWLVNSPGR